MCSNVYSNKNFHSLSKICVCIKKKKFSARSFDMDEDYTRLWKEKKLSPFDIRSNYHAIPPVLYEAGITTNISLF